MKTMTFDSLRAACRPGGPSCLSVRTELRPAAGREASVAPAKYASPGSGATAVYAYERRWDGDALRHAVVIDSKQSQLNRIEAAIALAIESGDPLLSRLPRIRVTYEHGGRTLRYTDLDLPHRAFDGHIRAGFIDGEPAATSPHYRPLRDATPANARALLERSPITLALGGWDASRRARQGRWRSLLVGEIIGFCADAQTFRRGGARVDPVGMQVQLPADQAEVVLEAQRTELSLKLVDGVQKEIDRARSSQQPLGLSRLGLGGIPPSLDQLAGVACDRIVRTHVLTFAGLRQIRFGGPPAADEACRAVLAGLALAGLVRSMAELSLRANCDLVEAGAPQLEVDARDGTTVELSPLDIGQADALLEEALAHAARVADLEWRGQTLEVAGRGEILAHIDDVEES